MSYTVQTQNEPRPSVLFTEKQGNLKQMFVFSSHCSLEELTTVHSPAVISLLAIPPLPQTHKISVLPTPMESGNGFWVVLYLGGSGFSEISSIQPF